MHLRLSVLIGIIALIFTLVSGGEAQGQTAAFVTTDTTTQGSWQGVYGGDGYDIVNDSQSIPSYASFSVSGGSTWTWGTNLTDVRALQTAENSSSRIAACWYNAYSFSMDVNVSDSNTHQFAIYAVDWDQSVRSATLQIVNADTNAQLDERSISGFQNGIWVVWNISGHVKLIITTTSSADSNAVVSGVFFGSAGSGGGSINVAVSPTSANLTDAQTQQFSAAVTGTSNTAVTWSISPNVGTISSSGLYTAPGTIISNSTVTVTATSQANMSSAGTASVTLTGGATTNFVTSDTTTQGSWQGAYGGDGYSLAQDQNSQSIPSYVTFSVSNESNWTWGSGLTDLRALQTSDNANRLAACWYNASSFTMDVNFTDGNSHQFAVYALDWQSFGLNETFQIRDSVTNTVLDSRTISSFQNGVYVVWNISGHVIITVTNNAYPNAVVSGVFFGSSGSSGGGSISVSVSPSTATVSASQTQQFTATVTGNSNTNVTWSLSPNVGTISSTGLYTAPSTITNSQSITVEATSVADTTKNGTAAANLTGGANATFVNQDTGTEGNWHGVYGSDGYWVHNDTSNIPQYASLTVENQSDWTWESSTTDPRALQTGDNSGRIAATWYNPSSFDFDLNFTDGNTHQFALYAIDWDSKGRSETIQIVDASTAAVLDTERISSFVNGVYLVWNISGHIKINVTATAGPNGVVSGVFFSGVTGPQISSLSTPIGGIKEYMSIYGSNFGSGLNSGTSPCSNCTVTFGSVPVVQYQSWGNGAISFWIPDNATGGPVVVTVNGVSSNPESFTIVTYPLLTSLGIYEGGVGQYVGITGANFAAGTNGGTSPCSNCSVTFNGTPVTDYISWDYINIQVRAPAGFTTGPVRVIVNGVESNPSGTFVLISTPFISSTSTNTGTGAGPSPTYVGITGSNFGNSQCGECSVTFNGTPVTNYQSWSDNTIALYVPAGANTGEIVVHANGMDSNGSYFTIPGTGISTSNIYYYIDDALGTARVITDSSGNVCYDADFYPFGAEQTPVTDTCEQHYKFTGKERDSESGLDNFGARYFSNQFGRFMSPDSPSYANHKNPQTWNLYAYSLNNPVTFGDADGHKIDCVNNIQQCQADAAAATASVQAAERVTTTTTQHSFLGIFHWTETQIAITGDINSFRALSANASKLADLVTSRDTITLSYDKYARPSFFANGVTLNGGSVSYTPSQGYAAQAFIDPTRTSGVAYDPDALAQGIPQANTAEEFGHEVLGHIWGEMFGGDPATTRSRANMRDSIIGEDAVRALDPTRGQKGLESHHNYNEMPPDALKQ